MSWHRYARAIIIREWVIALGILVPPKRHVWLTLVFRRFAISGWWTRWWSVDRQVGSSIIWWVVV